MIPSVGQQNRQEQQRSRLTQLLDQQQASSQLNELPDKLGEWWGSIPARSKLVAGAASCFMLSNMDKVNMTVAIIPIAHELGWSSTVSGLVQSSFFWGFTLAQAPGGWLSSTFGGRRTLPPAVGLFSIGTALMPVAAGSSMAALCLSRSVVGLGEAMAPSAIIDMMARGIPKEQRAGAISTAYSGLHGGSIVGLLISPALIDMFGWRSLFAIYGVVGMAWVLAFNLLMEDIGKQDPELKALLEAPRAGCPATSLSAAGPSPSSSSSARDRQQQASTSAPAAAANAQQVSIPYRAMLRSQPVRALMFTHLAHNWLNYTMLAWLPSYFTYTLEVDLMHAAQTALLPPLVGILASSVAGRAADSLIASGVPLPTVRKAAQCTAFLVPATLLSALWLCEGINTDAQLTVATVTLALGASSFSLAGLYCTHSDMSPKYASALIGLTNTAGSLPGVFGVALVGFLLDQTGSNWGLSLFAPSAAVLAAGAAAYTFGCRNDAIDFDSGDNSPFAFESRLQRVRRAWDRVRGVASRMP